jgi:hypothetical protein
MRFTLLMIALVRLAAADSARDLAWQQDLDTLSTQLPKLHPNLFFQVSRTEWTGAVAELRAMIPQLSDVEVMAGLARVTAMVRDGHTNLFLTQRNSSFRLLPLQMRWFEDGLFITSAGQDYPRALGARVVQIGDVPLDRAYLLAGGIISHENDSWVREISPQYLLNADLLQALRITASNISVPFVLEDRTGRFTVDIASLPPGTPAAVLPDAAGFTPFWRQHTDRNYWFTYVPSSKLLYFAYNVCREQNDVSFAVFNDLLWQTFDANPVETFVVDLRNNTGGNSSVIDPFVASGFARLDRLAGVRAVAIIGRRTFSAAITDAIGFKQGRVYLVGEPSGGSPNSYGEVQSFALPYSKLTVSYSTKHFSFPGYPDGPLMPDVPVRSYSADYFARHDPFLAAVLAGTDPGTTVGSSAVFNAAAPRLDQPVAPGSLASTFVDLGEVTAADASTLPLPELLSGVSVSVNGKSAPLLAVRAGQINFQVPQSTEVGMATVSIRRGGGEVASYSAWIAGSAPGIFGLAGSGPVMTIWATGQGLMQTPPRVYFGADLAEVLYSGATSYPGLWQINVKVPPNVSGEMPVFVALGGNASNGSVSKLF